MTKKGREFNEIYDLTAMRVIVASVKDCYGAIGIIHSLWKRPVQGLHPDPKLNLYQALHDRDRAEAGHWRSRSGPPRCTRRPSTGSLHM